MAKAEEASKQVLSQVARLLEVADGDTAYRDLYLARARELLLPVFSEERYATATQARSNADAALRQARSAIAAKAFDQAKKLSDQAVSLRQLADTEAAMVDATHALYSAEPVAFDPFSPALQSLSRLGADPASSRAALLQAFDALGKSDVAQATFYAARRTAVAAFPLPTDLATPAATTMNAASLETMALAAAERGDAAALQALLEKRAEEEAKEKAKEAAPKTAETAAAPRSGSRAALPPALTQPFPTRSVELATAVGFEHAEIRALSAETAGAISEYVDRYAWNASLSEPSPPREGVTNLKTALGSVPLAPEVTDVMAATLSLFAWQVFMNSGGIRFVPFGGEPEFVLVENFAEGEEASSKVLEALGLAQRRALARDDVEGALFRHGARILREQFELDPAAFRLVCVPMDVYARLGTARSWGTRPLWTHFDGYRVIRGGKKLAMIGGNSNFGGLADLCGIGTSDQRDNVVLRLAVVRRERIATRLV